jgi:hypothetical protein
MLALNEYFPGSRLLAGGRIYSSHGVIRSFEPDGGGFGLTRYRFECTRGHVFYDMQANAYLMCLLDAQSQAEFERSKLDRSLTLEFLTEG